MIAVSKKPPRDKWDIEHDVRVLQESREIKNDPTRLRDAQNMIREKRRAENDILGMKPSGSTSPNYGKFNAAYRGPLPVPRNDY